MNILTFNWHTPYLSLLAELDHHFDVAPKTKEGVPAAPWHETMRPLRPNISPITTRQALDRLKKRSYYDLILAHNVMDLVFTKEVSLPKILVFHNKLSTEVEMANNPDIIPSYRQTIREMISGVYCVFISKTKRYDWGLPGDIILPGIDISLYGGYTGEIARVLRVGNQINLRDLMCGYSIQEKILQGLASVVIGDNPDIPVSRPSRNWEELKQAYRENRLFLNTNISPWEDGYNLAMMEAMATGMPVVSLANPVSAITDGIDGFVADDVAVLRHRVEQLLGNLDMAWSIGAEGKRTVEKLFPMTRFLERWEKAIQRACSWYPHEPKMPSALFFD